MEPGRGQAGAGAGAGAEAGAGIWGVIRHYIAHIVERKDGVGIGIEVFQFWSWE